MDKKNKSKIIFVNSFKGGSGKSTIALSLCVSAALDNPNLSDLQKYANIYYFDIDLLGSGTYYLLYGEDKDDVIKFLNNSDLMSKNSAAEISKIIKDIDFEFESNNYKFKASTIDPSVRGKNHYTNGLLNTRRNAEILDEVFNDTLFRMIKEITEEQQCLLIFDCSPGFNNFTSILYKKLYSIYNIELLFITTFDSSHVNKTLESARNCLKLGIIPNKYGIVLNDVHNVVNTMGGNYKDDIMKKIKDELGQDNESVKVYYNKYIERINSNNAYPTRATLKSNADPYIIVDSDFKEVIKSNG